MNTEELARKALEILGEDVGLDSIIHSLTDLMVDQIPATELKFGDHVLVRDSVVAPWFKGLFICNENNGSSYRVIVEGRNASFTYLFCKLDPNIKTITMHKWSGGECPCLSNKIVLAKLSNKSFLVNTADRINWDIKNKLGYDVIEYAALEYAVLE